MHAFRLPLLAIIGRKCAKFHERANLKVLPFLPFLRKSSLFRSMDGALAAFNRQAGPAEKLLEEMKLDGVFPVPLEAIAKQKGYDCLVFDPIANPQLADVAGMVNHEAKKIFINRNDNILRQRFTLAHEIGHIVLHQGRSVVDFRKNIEQPSTPEEVEANRFAADLVMPAIPFIKEWLQGSGDYDSIVKRFGVSAQAAKIRAQTFKLDNP